ncbi:hypothetical protein, partial [Escherichia coli]|uniref:hypothetical protein n=1 Tax=Escherichia coli TaxID=562 RepID=UPI001A7E06F0
KSAQIREILISESAWEEMTCLFAPSKMEMHKQSGAPTPDEYFSPDAEFMAQVEERLGSCLTEEQRRYFDVVDSAAGIDLNSYFGREIEHFDAAPSMPEPEPEMAADPEAEQRKRVFNAIGIRY